MPFSSLLVGPEKVLCVTKKPKQRKEETASTTSYLNQSVAKRTMVASMTPGRSMAMATAILSAAAGLASGEGKMIRVLLVARLIYSNA